MLYFVRHAQSEANRDGIYAGSTIDSRLTDSGIVKFREFSRNNTHVFNKIFVSTLSRSIDSGKIFQEEQVYPIVLSKDVRINELDFGYLSGKEYRNFNNTKMYEHFDIERKHDFYKRIRSFYDDIKEQARTDDILIVGHAGVGKMLLAIARELPYENYNDTLDIARYKIYSISA